MTTMGWGADDSAKLLARLILSDRSLLGYTDIGKRAFGGWASGFINVLYVLLDGYWASTDDRFCLELFALRFVDL